MPTPIGSVRFTRRIWIVLLVAVAGAGTHLQLLGDPDRTGQLEQELSQLEIGTAFEAEISAGQEHRYGIRLLEGEYLNVAVDQTGIDVLSTICDPDGTSLADFDRDTMLKGLNLTDSIFWIATRPGIHELRVRPRTDKAGAGHYRIRIVELRPARTTTVIGLRA